MWDVFFPKCNIFDSLLEQLYRGPGLESGTESVLTTTVSPEPGPVPGTPQAVTKYLLKETTGTPLHPGCWTTSNSKCETKTSYLQVSRISSLSLQPLGDNLFPLKCHTIKIKLHQNKFTGKSLTRKMSSSSSKLATNFE